MKGDLNVRLVKQSKVKETTIGKHPLSGGARNGNGKRFMDVCRMNDLVKTSTVSRDILDMTKILGFH